MSKPESIADAIERIETAKADPKNGNSSPRSGASNADTKRASGDQNAPANLTTCQPALQKTRDDNDYVYESTVRREYGLTPGMIAELGPPDEYCENPHYRRGPLASLYRVGRVKAWVSKNQERVDKAKAERPKRSAAAKAAFERLRAAEAQAREERRRELQRAVEESLSGLELIVRSLPDTLLADARRTYKFKKDFQFQRNDGCLKQKALRAYILHSLTNFHQLMSGFCKHNLRWSLHDALLKRFDVAITGALKKWIRGDAGVPTEDAAAGKAPALVTSVQEPTVESSMEKNARANDKKDHMGLYQRGNRAGKRWAKKKARPIMLKRLYDYQPCDGDWEKELHLHSNCKPFDRVKALCDIMDPPGRYGCLWFYNQLGSHLEDNLQDTRFALGFVQGAIDLWNKTYRPALEQLQALRQAGDVMGIAKLHNRPVYSNLMWGDDALFLLTPDEARAVERLLRAWEDVYRSCSANHKQARLNWNGKKYYVDEKIAPLILALWQAGIDTCSSCQESPLSREVRIEFNTLRDAKAFLNLVGRGNLIKDDQKCGYAGIMWRSWGYDISIGDLVRERQIPASIPRWLTHEENGVIGRNPNPACFSYYRCSIMFPREDLQPTLELVLCKLNRGQAWLADEKLERAEVNCSVPPSAEDANVAVAPDAVGEPKKDAA